MSSQPQSRSDFQAEIESGSLADLGLVLFENSPMQVFRTGSHIADANVDELFLCRQIHGTLALEQCGREVALKPGDMTLLDPMLAYRGRFGTGSKLLLVKVPRRSLEARMGKLAELTAVAMKPDNAECRLASSFIAMLPGSSGQLSPASHDSLEGLTLDLIVLCLAKAMSGRPRLSSGQALILLKIRAVVEARLADPDLDAKSVADAACVSVRYANDLLALENTSLLRLIRTRRLTRCRNALVDPLQARRTITEIAFGWGFSDMTHFGRVFKKAYGVLPSEYRKDRSA